MNYWGDLWVGIAGWVARPWRQQRGKALQTLRDLFTRTRIVLVGDESS